MKNKLPGNLFPAWSARCFTGRLFLLWGIGLVVIFPIRAQTTLLDSTRQEQFSTLFSNPLHSYTFNKDPEKLLPDRFLNHYATFLSLMTREDKSQITAFHDDADLLIDDLDQPPITSREWAHLIGSQIALQQSLVYFHFRQPWKALGKMQQARRFFIKQQHLHPGYRANQKLEALFEILLGSIPENYKMVAGWLGYSGDREKGWNMLKRYGREVEYQAGWQKEWLMWRGFCALKLGLEIKPPTAVQHQIITQTPVLAFLYGWEALKQHRGEASLQITAHCSNEFPLLYYVRGMALLTDLNTDEACVYLNRFLEEYPGNSYKADATRRIAWIKIVENDSTAARNLLTKTIEIPPHSSIDREAIESSVGETLPDRSLLIARLLYDGGRYKDAVSRLQCSDTTQFNTYNLLEYHYRMGKSLMAASETKEALIHLKQAWNITGQKKPGYMTTYAALELASHYKGKGDLPNARLWAKRCLSTNKGPYSQHVKQQISWLEL